MLRAHTALMASAIRSEGLLEKMRRLCCIQGSPQEQLDLSVAKVPHPLMSAIAWKSSRATSWIFLIWSLSADSQRSALQYPARHILTWHVLWNRLHWWNCHVAEVISIIRSKKECFVSGWVELGNEVNTASQLHFFLSLNSASTN